MKNLIFSIVLYLGFSLSGCALKSGSVPTNVGAFQNPRIQEKDQSRIDLSLGAYSEIFGAVISNSALGYVYGIDDNSEVNFNLGYLYIDYGSDLDSIFVQSKKNTTEASVITANLNYRVNPFGESVAFWVGGGVGNSEYATLVSIQTGLMLSYINKYLIPSVEIEVWGSQPYMTKEYCYDGECIRPMVTYGQNLGFGLSTTISDQFLIALKSSLIAASSSRDTFGFFGLGLRLGTLF